MRESFWGYAVIVLGLIAITTIWFIANVTRTDQNNYNVLKETVEAAMYDAIDLSAYRESGQVVMSQQDFIESFLRRFSENADLSNNYLVEFFDVNSDPPKVSMRVSSTKTSSSRDEDTGELINVDIVNNIDAILETKYKTKDHNNSENVCDKDHHCVVSVDYVSAKPKETNSHFESWIIYPDPLHLPESVLAGKDKSKLHTKVITARWSEKPITEQDLIDREKNKCNMFLGFDIGDGYRKMSCTADSVDFSKTLTNIKFMKIQPITSSIHYGANLLTALKLELYFNKDTTKTKIASWFTVDWEYWFE